MKRKEIQELKDKPVVELQKMLKENRDELRKAMFDFEAGKLQNVRALKAIKKQIARLQTFIKLNNGK